MKLASRGAEAIASYWAEFADVSHYKLVLTDKNVPRTITTKVGDKTVGSLIRSKTSSGVLLLLPDIDFSPEHFYVETDDGVRWTKEAEEFAARLLAAVVALDKSLRSEGDVTPMPTWAGASEYVLEPEGELRANLLEAEHNVEIAVKRKEELEDKLRDINLHRALLYEKGKPLENAIIEALRVLGFTAAPYRDSGSEFDVVFVNAEGRLIGEAEGKDNKPISVDKLRQLSMNIHEDLQRDCVDTPAKPVLFGNAFRLSPLSERGEPFTAKCMSAAATSSTALVFTPDLFAAVQYLLANPPDTAYARQCRSAILGTAGQVSFPAPPKGPDAEVTEEVTLAPS